MALERIPSKMRASRHPNDAIVPSLQLFIFAQIQSSRSSEYARMTSTNEGWHPSLGGGDEPSIAPWGPRTVGHGAEAMPNTSRSVFPREDSVVQAMEAHKALGSPRHGLSWREQPALHRELQTQSDSAQHPSLYLSVTYFTSLWSSQVSDFNALSYLSVTHGTPQIGETHRTPSLEPRAAAVVETYRAFQCHRMQPQAPRELQEVDPLLKPNMGWPACNATASVATERDPIRMRTRTATRGVLVASRGAGMYFGWRTAMKRLSLVFYTHDLDPMADGFLAWMVGTSSQPSALIMGDRSITALGQTRIPH